jgi:glycosyltransferase 2 family protein
VKVTPVQTSSSHSDRRSLILRTLGTVLAFALLVYLLSQQGWAEIKAAFQQIPPVYLLLALILMVVSRLAVCLRWHVLLRSGGLPISLSQTTQLTFAGLFANNFLPATIGGDIIRLAGAVQLKFDGAIAAASLIADRLVGMAGMAMAAPIGLARVIKQLSLLPMNTIQTALFLLPVLFLGVDASSQNEPGQSHSPGWLHKTWRKSLDIMQRLLSALGRWLKQPRALLESLVYSWVNMLCLFGFLSLVFRGMGQSAPFWLIAGLYSLVYFVTLIPISINGYGLQELSMTLIFSHYAGITVASGITAALLFRTMMMLVSLPGAFFVPKILAGEKKAPVPESGAGE